MLYVRGAAISNAYELVKARPRTYSSHISTSCPIGLVGYHNNDDCLGNLHCDDCLIVQATERQWSHHDTNRRLRRFGVSQLFVSGFCVLCRFCYYEFDVLGAPTLAWVTRRWTCCRFLVVIGLTVISSREAFRSTPDVT